MSALSTAFVVAELQARDLLRRRAVMTLFVLLPAAFYYSVPATEDYSLIAGLIGVSWAVSAAGLFGILGWRGVDPRLMLVGAKPAQGLLGRLLLLQALGVGLVAIFAPQFLWRSADLIVHPPILVAALVTMAVVSVPLGLAIGALVPRELEGTLVLIGIVGVGMSVPPDSVGAQWLPLWGALELVLQSAGWSDGAIVQPVIHALGSSGVLLAIAYVAWRRRTRIRS